MSYRLDCLHCRYPRQPPVSTYIHHRQLPQDVHRITPDHLAALPPVGFFAAGPPCQNFSRPGPRLGWKRRTSRVFPVVLSILHQLMQNNRLTYVIENVPATANGFPELTRALGQSVTGDAVDHGSAARSPTHGFLDKHDFAAPAAITPRHALRQPSLGRTRRPLAAVGAGLVEPAAAVETPLAAPPPPRGGRW